MQWCGVRLSPAFLQRARWSAGLPQRRLRGPRSAHSAQCGLFLLTHRAPLALQRNEFKGVSIARDDPDFDFIWGALRFQALLEA